ncbi:MAG TPA: hypothetical protein DDW76_25305 [Cyanobacteria bacterium UBA11369]|nr:hypothetical protein [Cyanobacteria bacterium UBA8553]HAZ43968.1 hypothetical protein [Cyanobacteria bacterium UBA11371]HBE52001.1 hypothetical protein [Cyanobacteria bacterium UBA11369]
MLEFKPTQLPPAQTGNGANTKPKDLSAAELAMMTGMAVDVDTAPSLSPSVPQESMDWQNNKKFNGSWCIDENRNVWYHVEGIGWKKLTYQSESGIVALNILAAHAKQTQSIVNYRDEADGMIYEMYVW